MMETSPVFCILLASVFSTFLFFVGGSGALKDVEIVLPRYVRRGEDVKMTCNYNPEKDQLYAVNWYRANKEFYRYVWKESPPQQPFPRQLPGTSVDVRRSNNHDVYLKNASLDISGLYKCSVTAEQSFQTLSSSSEMTVVVIEDDMPSVQLDRAQYHPGDLVTAECQSPASFPPANITWFIQEKDGSWVQVGPEKDIKTDLKISNTDGSVVSRISRFSFDLPITEKSSAPVSLKCRVTVFTVYDQNSTIHTVVPTPRRLTATDTLLRPGTSSSSTRMLVAPDSALRFLLVLLPSGISTSSCFFSLVKSLNGLLTCVIWAFLYPFYYFYHHHYSSQSKGW